MRVKVVLSIRDKLVKGNELERVETYWYIDMDGNEEGYDVVVVEGDEIIIDIGGEQYAPLKIEDGVVPLKIEDGVVPLKIEDGVVPLKIEDGVVPLKIEDGVVPLEIEDGVVTAWTPHQEKDSCFSCAHIFKEDDFIFVAYGLLFCSMDCVREKFPDADLNDVEIVLASDIGVK